MKIDLHMHSTHSDGEMKPEELLYEALKNGVSVMSITDHDEISGYILNMIREAEYPIVLEGYDASSDSVLMKKHVRYIHALV